MLNSAQKENYSFHGYIRRVKIDFLNFYLKKIKKEREAN